MSDYSQLGSALRTEIGVPLGNIAVSEGFKGETANAVRQKAAEFLQLVQLSAYNIDVLAGSLEKYEKTTKEFLDTPNVAAQYDDMNEIWHQAQQPRPFYRDGKGLLKGDTITSIEIGQDGHVSSVTFDDGSTGGYGDLRKCPIQSSAAVAVDTAFHEANGKARDEMTAAGHEVAAMPLASAVMDGSFKGELNLKGDSIFDDLNGSFGPGDFTNEKLNKITFNGMSDMETSSMKDSTESKSEENLEGEGEGQEDATGNIPQQSGGVMPPSSFAPSSGGPRSGPGSIPGGAPNARWKVKEVSADDIYDILKDKYGVDGEGAVLGPSDSGKLIDLGPSSSYEDVEFTRMDDPQYDSADFTTRTSSYVPSTPSYTPSSYTPVDYSGSRISSPGYTSSSVPTSTSSFSPASFSSGRNIPAGQFNSMIDRLNNPIVTRGATGANGAPGASASGGLVSRGMSGESPMRSNASTYGTGGSAAGSQRGAVAGMSPASGGAGGARGMGMMPMMPMGGMGGVGGGAGRGGSGDSQKAKIKNQDGDLYGNDIKSVAPIISAGRRPAGMEPSRQNNEGKM